VFCGERPFPPKKRSLARRKGLWPEERAFGPKKGPLARRKELCSEKESVTRKKKLRLEQRDKARNQERHPPRKRCARVAEETGLLCQQLVHPNSGVRIPSPLALCPRPLAVLLGGFRILAPLPSFGQRPFLRSFCPFFGSVNESPRAQPHGGGSLMGRVLACHAKGCGFDPRLPRPVGIA
jgi:hypothetical protein